MEIKPFIIGLTGLSGSGKTYFVDQLKNRLVDHLTIVGFDDYYKPLEEQEVDEHGEANYDLPTALYSDRFHVDLLQLANYNSIVIRKYQFEHYDAPDVMETIHPAPIIVVEGLFVMEFSPVDAMLDYRIFVDCDTNLCFERRLQRDVRERNIPRERSLHQWKYHVMPAYENFIEPHKGKCDMVVQNAGSADKNIDKIMDEVLRLADPSVIQKLQG